MFISLSKIGLISEGTIKKVLAHPNVEMFAEALILLHQSKILTKEIYRDVQEPENLKKVVEELQKN